jgi:hypothetical protein
MIDVAAAVKDFQATASLTASRTLSALILELEKLLTRSIDCLQT